MSGVFTDAVAAVAQAIEDAGFRAVTDPRNVSARCVFVELPTFESFTTNIADISISVKVLAAPPGNNDAFDWVMTTVDALLAANLPITSGRPITWLLGQMEYPGYDLTVRLGERRY
jgi:hypothetical protein